MRNRETFFPSTISELEVEEIEKKVNDRVHVMYKCVDLMNKIFLILSFAPLLIGLVLSMFRIVSINDALVTWVSIFMGNMCVGFVAMLCDCAKNQTLRMEISKLLSEENKLWKERRVFFTVNNCNARWFTMIFLDKVIEMGAENIIQLETASLKTGNNEDVVSFLQHRWDKLKGELGSDIGSGKTGVQVQGPDYAKAPSNTETEVSPS